MFWNTHTCTKLSQHIGSLKTFGVCVNQGVRACLEKRTKQFGSDKNLNSHIPDVYECFSTPLDIKIKKKNPYQKTGENRTETYIYKHIILFVNILC